MTLLLGVHKLRLKNSCSQKSLDPKQVNSQWKQSTTNESCNLKFPFTYNNHHFQVILRTVLRN